MQGPQIPEDYAAYPRAHGYAQFGPAPGRVRFDIFTEAWTLVFRDLGPWLVASLVAGGIVAVTEGVLIAMVLPSILSNKPGDPIAMRQSMGILTIGFAFVYSFAVGVANAGILRMALKKVRGQEAGAGDIFSLNGMAGQVILAEGLLALLPVLPAVAGLIPIWIAGPNPDLLSTELVSVLLQLTAWIVVAVVQLLATFVPMLIVDRRMAVGEAMKKSFAVASPHFWPLFGLILIVSMVAGLGALACGIGLLFTMPIYYAARALLYHDFFRTVPSDASAPTAEQMVNPPTFDPS